MGGRNASGLPAALRRASDQFERWRNAHELGTRIPEKLWRLAARLAVAHGVSRTASTLKLDYYFLKRRLPQHVSKAVLPATPTPATSFLELPASAFATAGECIIDLEHSNGTKIRIHYKGVAPDLVTLGRAFWSAG
jgi:hypothetical protein